MEITKRLRAKAIYSVTPAITIVVGLAAAKMWAVLLGPGGLGVLALMQSFVTLASVIAGMGVGTAFVRAASDAAASGDARRVTTLRRAAISVTTVLAAAAAALIAALSPVISNVIFDRVVPPGQVLLLAATMAFSVGYALATSFLNAEQRPGRLSTAGVVNIVVVTAAVLIAVLLWRVNGIAIGLTAGTFIGFISAAILARGRVEDRQSGLYGQTRTTTLDETRALVRFGGPFMMATVAGAAIQLVLPIIILRLLGADSIGYYRAAAVVPLYLSMFLSAAVMDYYPRISAAADADVPRIARDERRIVTMLAFPMIAAVFALAPLLIPAVYSTEFRPAVPLLRWMMAGEIFRFWAWSAAYALLARGGSVPYFIAELTSALAYTVLTLLIVPAKGLTGIGIAYVIAQVLYAIVVILLMHRKTDLSARTAQG